jgi:hypothetical protein
VWLQSNENQQIHEHLFEHDEKLGTNNVMMFGKSIMYKKLAEMNCHQPCTANPLTLEITDTENMNTKMFNINMVQW